MKPSKHALGERATPTAASPASAPADTAAEPQPAPESVIDVEPVPVRGRWDGWTAERQRVFLTVLSETGSISEACAHAGVSSRSAYRLRARADATAFARAWDEALRLATARLTTLAYERAVRGTVTEHWVDGQLARQTRQPSDKLLMFLLAHLLPAGRPGERWAGFEAMGREALDRFPRTLGTLTDSDVELVPISNYYYFGAHPFDTAEEA